MCSRAPTTWPEHRIISALASSAVPVAPALGLCEDLSVNEAPFYVMSFVDGMLYDADSARDLPAEARAAIGDDVVDVLAALHAIDPDAVGLGTLGRKGLHIARQLKRWTTQWENSSSPGKSPPWTGEPFWGAASEQLGAAIVHGDYRLGNMIVADGKIQGVLDWELCTLGDPWPTWATS